jgi:hypothetical protein
MAEGHRRREMLHDNQGAEKKGLETRCNIQRHVHNNLFPCNQALSPGFYHLPKTPLSYESTDRLIH